MVCMLAGSGAQLVLLASYHLHTCANLQHCIQTIYLITCRIVCRIAIWRDGVSANVQISDEDGTFQMFGQSSKVCFFLRDLCAYHYWVQISHSQYYSK